MPRHSMTRTTYDTRTGRFDRDAPHLEPPGSEDQLDRLRSELRRAEAGLENERRLRRRLQVALDAERKALVAAERQLAAERERAQRLESEARILWVPPGNQGPAEPQKRRPRWRPWSKRSSGALPPVA
jgi:chromosome segregation ATPase